MTLLASVQTADDTTLPSLTACLLILAASLLITLALFAPVIRDAWRETKRIADTRQPTVPRQLTDRNARLPRQEHRIP